MSDPTYIKQEIDKNPVWKMAFRMSELDNNTAPIGWGVYIPRAEMIINRGVVKKKESK